MWVIVLTCACVVFATMAVAPVRAQNEVRAPEWTIGDWWETDRYRLTVSSRERDWYELIRTPRGRAATAGATGHTKLRMSIDGRVGARVERDGSMTETLEDSRHEWVRFPLQMGSGWTFGVLGRGRTIHSSERYDYQCAPTKWEDIDVGGKLIPTLRIECQSGTRGSSQRWQHSVWYSPDAKRYIRLTSHYMGGPTFNCSAWSVQP